MSYRNRAVARSLPDFPRPHQPPSGNMDKQVRQLDGEPSRSGCGVDRTARGLTCTIQQQLVSYSFNTGPLQPATLNRQVYPNSRPDSHSHAVPLALEGSQVISTLRTKGLGMGEQTAQVYERYRAVRRTVAVEQVAESGLDERGALALAPAGSTPTHTTLDVMERVRAQPARIAAESSSAALAEQQSAEPSGQAVAATEKAMDRLLLVERQVRACLCVCSPICFPNLS